MKCALRACVALIFSAVLSLAVTCGTTQSAETLDEGGTAVVYFGTYTRGDSKGIYQCRMNPETGDLSSLELAGEAVNPSFLAIHPNRQYLYSVMEVESLEGRKTGGVGAFVIDPHTRRLTLINQQESGGGGPCHLVVDHSGSNVLVANYGGGSIACLPIRSDGGLKEASTFVQHEGSGVNPQRQEAPHAHSINVDAANRFAFVADLGLDKILVYRFEPATGKLTSHEPPAASVFPGAGPRHFAFHPSGRFAYVINEMQSTVTGFEYDPEGGILKEIQTVSTLPDDFDGSNSTAEVQVHPSGQFLYGSNRGHDSIAVFSIDDQGQLELVENEPTQGKTPRNFGLDPSGKFLLAANQGTDNVVVFQIDSKSGALSATGHSVSVPSPVCVKFLH